MPRPGVDVFIVDEPVKAAAILDPSQAFMIGTTERGRMGICKSFTEFKSKFGGRTAESQDLYDAVRAHFEESGGGTVYVSPVVGATATEATGDLGTVAEITARGPGVWGNSVVVKTAAPASLTETALGGVVFEIESPTGTQVERTPAFQTIDQFVSWTKTNSNYVIASKTSDDALTTSLTVTLAGGTDDTSWGSAGVDDALDQFPYALGPGQVSAPGHNDTATVTAIAQHCLDNYRVALVDLDDDPDAANLAAQIADISAVPGSRNLLAVGPKPLYPHETNPATILAPASGVESGIITRCDKRGDPSLSAAGNDGYSARALGLSQMYSDGDREELNALGCSLFKDVYGQVRMYGYRTAAGPNETNWMFFQESRVIMMIAHEANAVLEEFVLKTIDGRGQMLARVNVALSGVCARYWLANALFGVTSGEAFRVDTVSPNSVESIAKGELHANIMLKTSKLAEWVVLNLVKYRTERSFPAAA